MRILHTVQLYDPKVGGSEEVVKQLSERLAARGHDVTVATAAEPTRTSTDIAGVHIKEFDISGNDIRGITGDTKSYTNFVASGKFDVIMNYAAQIWSTDLVLPIINTIDAAKVIVPCGYSALKDPNFADYFAQLPDLLKNYDKAIYLSPYYQDKLFADEHGLKNSVVIPNGADEREFNSKPQNFRRRYNIKTKYMLLCVANHYNLKGHQFIIDAFNRLERKDVTLCIIGNPVDAGLRRWRTECYKQCKLSALKNSHIKMLAHVPRDQVVSAYKEADLFVFGSMVECSPLVIFESMAAGLPFITTDVGDVRDRVEFGEIIDTVPAMAQQINRWLDDPDLRTKVGTAAKKEWRAKYSWDKITDQYEALYQEIVASKP